MLVFALTISLILGFFTSRYLLTINSTKKDILKSRKGIFLISLGTFAYFFATLNLQNFVRDNAGIQIFELTLLYIQMFATVSILIHLSMHDVLYLTQNKIWIYRFLLFAIGISLGVAFLRLLSEILFTNYSLLPYLNFGNYFNILLFLVGYLVFKGLELIIKNKSFTNQDVLLLASFGLFINIQQYFLFITLWILLSGLVAILAIIYTKRNYRTLIPIAPILLISYLIIFGYTDVITSFLNI